MHLKNWSVLYPDTRTPQLAPGYDFVSTIAYIKDRKMALSVAKEKDTKAVDRPLLEKFGVRAGLLKHMVAETALDTAEKTVRAWSTMASDLPLGNNVRESIEGQLCYIPITKQFLRAPSKSSSKKVSSKTKSARGRKPDH